MCYASLIDAVVYLSCVLYEISGQNVFKHLNRILICFELKEALTDNNNDHYSPEEASNWR